MTKPMDEWETNREKETALARRTEATVFISGATGTGKSTLAEEIHRSGPRKGQPFVAVNLATLHEATIEATLFGHERGAFTGADRARIGRLESADGGTLFLDEIGELSLAIQARLLEFLHSRTLTPLGGNRCRHVNARLICATNRNLEEDVRIGRFREDLFHRIRVLDIKLPSLNEMDGENFSQAVHRAVEKIGIRLGRSVHRLSKEIAELFECYSWPGNFRELENVLEVAILNAAHSALRLEDLPRWFVDKARNEPVFRLQRDIVIRSEKKNREFLASAEVPVTRNYRQTLTQFETAILRYYIDLHRGNLAHAARSTGLPKATFYRKAMRYGLFVDPIW